MNGFAIIDKHKGISSSDVVIKCRNALSRAVGTKIKCGHMGTLDPMAQGVLIVAFGNTTRLFDYMLAKTKTYIAEFTFGEERDTLDAEGQTTSCAQLPEYDAVIASIKDFTGEIQQVPPKYSAVKIGGKKAYDLARAGKDFEIKSKNVYIKDIKVLSSKLKDDKCESIKLQIECGGGTYIRSLCRDLAYKADTLGYMSSLVRTECGGFTLEDSVSTEEFMSDPMRYVRNTEELLAKIMPTISIDGNQYRRVRNGQSIPLSLSDGFYGAKSEGKLCFILRIEHNTAKSVCYLED